MQKSIIITSNAYFPNIGGVENSLRYLASSYKNLGYKVWVIVSDVAPNDAILSAEEVIDDITILRYPSYSTNKVAVPGYRAIKSSLAAWKLFKKINRQHNVGMTLSRFHTSTVIAWCAGLKNIKYLVPGVVKHQNSNKNLSEVKGLKALKSNLSQLVHHLIQKLALSLSDSTIVFSKNMEHQIKSVSSIKENLPILKPGVDIQRFCPVDNKKPLKELYQIPQDKVILLAVGRFVKAKGFELIIDAMQHLPECHLVVVGDGENWQEINKKIDSLSLRECISLMGSQSDTAPFYQLSDIFIMSSLYEPLGQTILEAIASGLPVVAFKGSQVTTATEELLSKEEAIYTEDVCSLGLVNVLRPLLTNVKKRSALSTKSRLIACENFSWDKLAKQIWSL